MSKGLGVAPRAESARPQTEAGVAAKPSGGAPKLRHYARRAIMGEIEIVDREFDFVRCILPYDYAFTCNSQQWREADLICRALEGPMESLGVVRIAPPEDGATSKDMGKRNGAEGDCEATPESSEPHKDNTPTPGERS